MERFEIEQEAESSQNCSCAPKDRYRPLALPVGGYYLCFCPGNAFDSQLQNVQTIRCRPELSSQICCPSKADRARFATIRAHRGGLLINKRNWGIHLEYASSMELTFWLKFTSSAYKCYKRDLLKLPEMNEKATRLLD
jgi:hypothetical protein